MASLGHRLGFKSPLSCVTFLREMIDDVTYNVFYYSNILKTLIKTID